MKKAMIRDLDGTLLGSPGTILPDSAFEWDGDPQRGLGDYRIPPMMVTAQDGSKIPYEDKMPNKGTYFMSCRMYCLANIVTPYDNQL